MRILVITIMLVLYSCKSSKNTAKNNTPTNTNVSSSIIDSIQGTWSLCVGTHAYLGDYKYRYTIVKNSILVEAYYFQSTNKTCQTPTMYIKGQHSYVKGTGTTFYEGATPIDITYDSPYTIKAYNTDTNVLNHLRECTGYSSASPDTTYIINPNFCVYTPFKTNVYYVGEKLYSSVFVDTMANPVYLNFGIEGVDDPFDGSTPENRVRYMHAPEYIKE